MERQVQEDLKPGQADQDQDTNVGAVVFENFVVGDYTVVKGLSQTDSTVVDLVKSKSGEQQVLKSVTKASLVCLPEVEKLRKGLVTMKTLSENHPHLVKVLRLFEDSDKFYWTMEYADSGPYSFGEEIA